MNNSTLAGVQAAVLLIAAKRADQIAASVSLHTLENTEQLTALLQQNTTLTEQIAALTREMHAYLAAAQTPATAGADAPPESSIPKKTPRTRSQR